MARRMTYEEAIEMYDAEMEHADGQCDGPPDCVFCVAERMEATRQRQRDAERWALRILNKIDHRI